MEKKRKKLFASSVFVLSWLPDGGFTGAAEIRGVYSNRVRAFEELKHYGSLSANNEIALSEWRDEQEVAVYQWNKSELSVHCQWSR